MILRLPPPFARGMVAAPVSDVFGTLMGTLSSLSRLKGSSGGFVASKGGGDEVGFEEPHLGFIFYCTR